jgi:hypothetical protein
MDIIISQILKIFNGTSIKERSDSLHPVHSPHHSDITGFLRAKTRPLGMNIDVDMICLSCSILVQTFKFECENRLIKET